MIKGLAALALGALIAVTPVATAPARANDAEDVLGAILGIAALGLIGAAIIDRNDDDVRRVAPRTVTRAPNRYYYHSHGRHAYHRHDRFQPHSHQGVHRHGNQRARFRLPDRCLRIFRTIDGNRRGFGNRCLQNNYRFAASLPDQCRRTILVDRGRRTIYFERL